MLEYVANTWQDIIDLAYNNGNAYEDNVTITLAKDINCNTEIPEGIETSITFSFTSANYIVTINGEYTENNVTKNHIIRNLRTHVVTPVTIFKSNTGTIFFKNIDFINLILDTPLFTTPNQSNGLRTTVYNCRFVGRRSTNLFDSTSTNSRGINLYRCFFNIPYIPVGDAVNTKLALVSYRNTSTAGGDGNQFANFCRFKEYYGGWSISNASGKYADSDLGCLKMNGCKVEGEIVGSYTSNNSIYITIQSSFTSIIQNAIDVDLKVAATEGAVINVYAPRGVWRNDIHSINSSITGTYAYTNVNGDDFSTPETPSRMKNANELYNDGFDIAH